MITRGLLFVLFANRLCDFDYSTLNIRGELINIILGTINTESPREINAALDTHGDPTLRALGAEHDEAVC